MGGAAASLGNFAVADEDAGLLAAVLTSAGRETTSLHPTAVNPARRRFLRREENDGLAASTEGRRGTSELRRRDRAALPNSLALGLPHAPSVPAARERAAPPGRWADSSSPPPSDVSPQRSKVSGFRLSAGSVVGGKQSVMTCEI
ncbi:hypothetical protein CRENBAI_004413 [Crenichthys baileyi]|uniref:Uncharacterized protein n=1 Tax=Crenichthys baileyi TaxID=28760 RepID=A0AAV9R3G9_9TELE